MVGGPANTATRPRENRRLIALALACGLLAAEVLGLWSSALRLSAPMGIALAILLAAATLWISEAVPLYVTSFVILLLNLAWLTPALDEAGEKVGETAFLAPFFSNVILLFLGGFVLSAALHKYMLDERLARWVLRHTGPKPSRVLLGMMLTTAFLSMWISNTATAAMMLGLAIPLVAHVPPDDPFRRGVLLGIAFAANLGGLGSPIGSPPNAIAMQYMTRIGDAPSFARWMLLAAPVLLLTTGALWLLLLRLYRPRISQLSLAVERPFRWSVKSVTVAGVCVMTALGWLTAGLHPLSTGAVGLVPTIAFFGAGLLDRDDFRRLPWDVLMLAAGGLSLGVAVETSGLATWFVGFVPTAGVGLPALVVAFALISGIMTSMMSNTATANLLIPVVLGVSGVPTSPLLMAVAYSCSLVMVLPVSTPPNAMAFGSGELTVKEMVVPGLAISAVGLVATCSLGLWWWSLWGVY